MNNLLEDFWIWLDKSPEEYAEYGLKYVYEHMEYDYPKFEELKNYAFEIVDNNIKSSEIVYDLLTILAIDNEDENVLEYIEDNSSNDQLQMIIEVGLTHIQPGARWQLSELLYRRTPPDFYNYLLILSNDNDAYVQKRARNCLGLLPTP